MNTIHKFVVPIGDNFFLRMPKGARILSVQTQKDVPQVWALVNTAHPLEERWFRLAGTGHPFMDEEVERILEFVGTFQMRNGGLVFHLFEVMNPETRLIKPCVP